MSKMQRNKGAQGEREAAGILTDLLGVPAIKRELSQTRDGGYDLLACDIAIEVKRTQAVGLDAALAQVDAAAPEMLGAVVHRANGKPWKVTMSIQDWCTLVRDAVDPHEQDDSW